MKINTVVQIETVRGSFTIQYYESGFIKVGDFCFAPEFRSLSYKGIQLWNYSRTQMTIIGYIFEYLEMGFSTVHQYELIRKLEERSFSKDETIIKNNSLETKRLRDFFKIKGGKVHPSFGSFIKTTKGRDSVIYLDFTWKPNN